MALSCGALWATILAADHPDRVDSVVYIGPAVGARARPPASGMSRRFEDAIETNEGWAKYNRHYWERDYLGFLEFFFGKCFTEPHSTKQIEDCIGWALETDTARRWPTQRVGSGFRAGRAASETPAHGSAARRS